MNRQQVVRDVAMLLVAGAIGWWAHGANTPVRAAGANLDFQFTGAAQEGTLTLYNPDNRTLYLYPAAAGNSHVNCAYSIHVEKPGGPLERQNCAIGSAFR